MQRGVLLQGEPFKGPLGKEGFLRARARFRVGVFIERGGISKKRVPLFLGGGRKFRSRSPKGGLSPGTASFSSLRGVEIL